jgi:hypothetical protein
VEGNWCSTPLFSVELIFEVYFSDYNREHSSHSFKWRCERRSL